VCRRKKISKREDRHAYQSTSSWAVIVKRGKEKNRVKAETTIEGEKYYTWNQGQQRKFLTAKREAAIIELGKRGTQAKSPGVRQEK